MTKFVISRKTSADYDQMIIIYNWCEEMFGRTTYDGTGWEIGFADSSEDYVQYTFLNESYATMFVLKWGQFHIDLNKVHLIA